MGPNADEPMHTSEDDDDDEEYIRRMPSSSGYNLEQVQAEEENHPENKNRMLVRKH